MDYYGKIYAELLKKGDRDLLKMVYNERNIYQSVALIILIKNLTERVCQLEKEILQMSGQEKQKRKRKIYHYEDVELTDKLLIEYIDSGAFTIYELEKKVGAKKNVLRERYNRAKKQIQAKKHQNDK